MTPHILDCVPHQAEESLGLSPYTAVAVEAVYPPEVVEAWWWVKTHCRHWALPGQDHQTLDELSGDRRKTAEAHLEVLHREGLVVLTRMAKQTKPGRSGHPNFVVHNLEKGPRFLAWVQEQKEKSHG